MIARRICYGEGGWWITHHPRLYNTFAKAAHTRNQMIVDEAASVAAFWDGQSKGTLSTINKAKSAGILYAVYGPDGEVME